MSKIARKKLKYISMWKLVKKKKIPKAEIFNMLKGFLYHNHFWNRKNKKKLIQTHVKVSTALQGTYP